MGPKKLKEVGDLQGRGGWGIIWGEGEHSSWSEEGMAHSEYTF